MTTGFRRAAPAPSSHAQAGTRRLLLAHYMPWYEADPANKRWGWHWTMNHFHPERETGKGRREAASRLYPLIGLYDSNDPDALECHVLLMKLAGIDGVIVDWYGIVDYLDYGIIHRNTLRLVEFVKRAGLKFAVMFEDQTVPKLIADKRLAESDAVAHGRRTLEWLQSHWFTELAYITRDNRPILAVFGSGYYTGDQWTQIFAGLPRAPYFFTEADRRPPAVGAFDWPHPGGGTQAALAEQDRFYRQAKEWPDAIAAAFPRFEDIYEEAGLHKSWGRIEDRGGRTFSETLRRALESPAPFIQLVTWNDWGEGTVIEPSVEYGYRDLEATQRLRRRYLDSRFPYAPRDLSLPVRLYQLRKRPNNSPQDRGAFEEASRLLFAGQPEKARARLAAYPDSASEIAR